MAVLNRNKTTKKPITALIFMIATNLINCATSDGDFVSSSAPDPTSKLLSVVTIFRHGDRTPIRPYASDPYRNASYWPEGFGQLTNLGKMRHLHLGQWLRRRYSTFLPLEYSNEFVRVQSTDVDRTLMSAEANLAGLFPPSGSQVWDSNLEWQPIPIHTRPELEDALLAMKKPCPSYERHLAEVLRTDPVLVDARQKNRDLFKYLAQHAGEPIEKIEDVEYLYSNLFIESQKNLTLPDWTRQVFPGRMRPLAELSFATMCFDSRLARLKTGLFFNELVSIFDNRTSRHDSRKFSIFSGHDVTIANILQSLGVFQFHCPPYASTIIFELRQSVASNYFVNIYYKNSTEPLKIKLPQCDFDCDLSQFKRLLEPLVLTAPTWHRECQLTWSEAINNYDYLNNVFVLVALIVAFMFFVFGLLVFAILKRCGRGGDDGDTTVYTQLPNDEVA